MHLRLDLHSFLPSFAIVDTAGEHDNKRAREVCAGLEEGEVVVFDITVDVKEGPAAAPVKAPVTITTACEP